jgi:hypothetical protein
VNAVPAGWYADPGQPGQQRYWDGSAWTEHVHVPPLFDGTVPLPIGIKGKRQRLVVTTEELVWGELHIRWDDVSWFTQLVSVQTGAEVEYTIRLVHGDIETGLIFGHGYKPDPDARRAYHIIIDQLRRTLGVRVVDRLLDMVEYGEAVRTAGLVLTPNGFGPEDKGDLVPWSEYAGLEVDGYQALFLRVFRAKGTKRKPVARVEITQLHSWVVPPVIEAFARRYGGRPDTPG